MKNFVIIILIWSSSSAANVGGYKTLCGIKYGWGGDSYLGSDSESVLRLSMRSGAGNQSLEEQVEQWLVSSGGQAMRIGHKYCVTMKMESGEPGQVMGAFEVPLAFESEGFFVQVKRFPRRILAWIRSLSGQANEESALQKDQTKYGGLSWRKKYKKELK